MNQASLHLLLPGFDFFFFDPRNLAKPQIIINTAGRKSIVLITRSDRLKIAILANLKSAFVHGT